MLTVVCNRNLRLDRRSPRSSRLSSPPSFSSFSRLYFCCFGGEDGNGCESEMLGAESRASIPVCRYRGFVCPYSADRGYFLSVSSVHSYRHGIDSSSYSISFWWLRDKHHPCHQRARLTRSISSNRTYACPIHLHTSWIQTELKGRH